MQITYLYYKIDKMQKNSRRDVFCEKVKSWYCIVFNLGQSKQGRKHSKNTKQTKCQTKQPWLRICEDRVSTGMTPGNTRPERVCLDLQPSSFV